MGAAYSHGMTDLLSTPQRPGRDFTKKRKPLIFHIDDDTFEAAAALPGDIYAEFVTRYVSTSQSDTYKDQHAQLKDALQLALLPQAWERFSARLKDKLNPIDDEQLSDVILWLLEEYGMRPTQPSQLSSDGSPNPESGMSSTDEQQPAVSTLEASPLTGS